MKNIRYILAVFFLATAMSAVSCKKEQKPDIETPTEKPSDNEKTPTTPVYQPSMGETILKAAAASGTEINGYTADEKETTFLFAEPFRYEVLDGEIVRASVSVPNDRIASLDDNNKTVKVTFPDNSSVSLKYQDAVEITFEGEAATEILDYPGAEYTYNYKATKIGHGSLEFSVKTEGEAKAENAYNADTREGVLKVILPEEPSGAGTVDLSFTDGFNSNAFSLVAGTYTFTVEAGTVSLGGSLAATAELDYKVTTDIPDAQVVITPAENAFFSMEGKTLTATNENRTGETRASYVEISEASGKMPSCKVEVRQDFIEGREDVVSFSDIPFKKAMLELCDANDDGEVSLDEALTVKEIVAPGRGIKTLDGLACFKNVEKLDLQDNDIKDGTVLKELPLLHWLDLKGNMNLKTFDVTTCCVYFDHCEFEVTEQLIYYLQRRQINVSYVSDYWCEYGEGPLSGHGKHIEDTRNSEDYTHQAELKLLKAHTKGDGQKAIVFTGMGYIDVDINDGSWDRLVKRFLDLIYENLGSNREYWDYLDIYSYSHITLNRYQYICTDEEWDTNSQRYIDAFNGFHNEFQLLERKCYRAIFGPIQYINNQCVVNDDIKLLICYLDIVPIPNQPSTIKIGANRLWLSPNSPYPEQFKNVYEAVVTLSLGLDIIDKTHNDSPEHFFTDDVWNLPESINYFIGEAFEE